MATITGKITINNVWACTFASDPSVSGGTVAPIGSFGSVNDGTGLWVKTGSRGYGMDDNSKCYRRNNEYSG